MTHDKNVPTIIQLEQEALQLLKNLLDGKPGHSPQAINAAHEILFHAHRTREAHLHFGRDIYPPPT